MTTTRPPRVLGVVIAVLLVSGGVAAATTGRSDRKGESNVQASATTSAPSPTTPATTAAPRPATTIRRPPAAAAPATTAAPAAPAAPATTATTAAPVVPKPPASGKYLYRERITNRDGTRERDSDLSYTTAKQSDGELRQTELDGQEGSIMFSSLAWRADGAYLRSFRQDDIGDDSTYSCDLEPDMLLYPSPITVGRTWTIDSSCDGDRFQSTTKVTGTERLTVGDRQLEVYVIESSGRLPGDDVVTTFKNVERFSAELGLTIREETRYRYEADGQLFEELEVFELLTVVPQ